MAGTMISDLGRQIKVEFGDVSFGARAAATTLKFDISPDDPAAFVGRCYMEYRKRRLVGRIILGDDMPEQGTFVDRLRLDGLFDTHNPSFGDDKISLRITFDASEIAPEDLLKFCHKSGWIQIDQIQEIPKPAKDKVYEDDGMFWESEPIARLGLDNKLVQSLFDGGVKQVGDLVQVALGHHESISFESLKIPKGRQATIREKLELFIEDCGVENPLA